MIGMTDLAPTPLRVGSRIWPLLVGPVIWAAHLLVSYFGGAVRCQSDPSIASTGWLGRSDAGSGFITVATIVAAAILAATIAWSIVQYRRERTEPGHDSGGDRSGEPFVHLVAIGVNAFSLTAVVLEGVWAVISRC